jgi:uncharacterized membrane protein YfcA
MNIRLLLFFLIAFIPSVAGAICGIGGGIVIKPVLDMLSGNSPKVINFLSSTTVLCMTAVTLSTRLLQTKKSCVKLEAGRGTALALGAALGGILGKLLFQLAVTGLPGNKIGVIQSLSLLILSIGIFIYNIKQGCFEPKRITNIMVCAFWGICLGIMSTFLGIGGGPLHIPVISFFLGMDTKTTSLHVTYIVFLSQLFNFITTVVTGTIPAVSLPVIVVMIAGGIIGGWIGSQLLLRMKNRHADLTFRFFLAVVIFICAWNTVKFGVGYPHSD